MRCAGRLMKAVLCLSAFHLAGCMSSGSRLYPADFPRPANGDTCAGLNGSYRNAGKGSGSNLERNARAEDIALAPILLEGKVRTRVDNDTVTIALDAGGTGSARLQIDGREIPQHWRQSCEAGRLVLTSPSSAKGRPAEGDLFSKQGKSLSLQRATDGSLAVGLSASYAGLHVLLLPNAEVEHTWFLFPRSQAP